MKKTLIILTAICFAAFARAQDYAGLNQMYYSPDSNKSKSLSVQIENLNFFLNNEFKGNIVDGYTWTGAWLRPKLEYQFNNNLKLSLGGHFLKYHGRENFTINQPWFSAYYQISKKLAVIFGNLNQNNNYGLVKQLWEPERTLTDSAQEGIQFLYKNKYLNINNWMSWEQFILEGDQWQEHFTFGLNSDALIYSNSNLKINFPIQLMIYHKGGEIDTSPLSVVTHYNYASGLELTFDIEGEFISNIEFNNYWLGYKCPDGPSPFPYEDGHAYSVVASAKTKIGTIAADYWNGYQFAAPFGKKIYSSSSSNDLDLSKTNRSILSLSYTYNKEIIKDAHFAFQTETFYDFPNASLSFGFGFYLKVSTDFVLKQF